ncbi:hypothetical protein NF867_03150 [Solitalea sp. MAHUQ-68]|uniref:DNA-deoxyinosine glycosylase n=1 Tax=Solitalea agri TaxID=2953739 RepID=A0A9X2EZD9_9SPHI|nr:hypothetical protein [Solitalea agri]MCO4291857.1 hypothetical protein [Solitalea agri]
MLVEHHPFPAFIPENAKYLIMGTFPGRDSTLNPRPEIWTFESERNQFWKLFRTIYNRSLSNKAEKQQLFSDLKLANTDIILSCSRKNNSNLDSNLINKIYNTTVIEAILINNPIEKIYLTGKSMEVEFRSKFKEIIQRNNQIQIIPLPSPSPAYASMSFQQKLEIYNNCLPTLFVR